MSGGSAVDALELFAGGHSGRYLSADDTVLVIPFGFEGNSMLWHAQAGMSFRMAGGYVGAVTPVEPAHAAIVDTFYRGVLGPDSAERLRAFVGAHGITKVVVVDSFPGPWAALFGTLDPAPERVAGMTMYRVPDRLRAPGADVIGTDRPWGRTPSCRAAAAPAPASAPPGPRRPASP